ncbi:MAG: hypothetical protein AAFV53_07555 [Myxococcota bacterium]
MIPPQLQQQVRDRFGEPLEWLQRGRSPVARLADGILRIGAAVEIEAEQRDAIRDRFPDVPHTLLLEPPFLLETDLGGLSADPLGAVLDFHAALPSPRTEPLHGTVREILATLPPEGGINPTHLIRALREKKRQGVLLPVNLRRLDLRATFDKPLHDITVDIGWSHGRIRLERLCERGICHWRHAGPELHREADLAPLIAMDAASRAVLLHQIKQRWRHDPVEVLEALDAMGLVDAPVRRATLQKVSAHPAIRDDDIEAIVGCPLNTLTSARRVGHALGRAKNLIVAGAPLVLTATPAVSARPDRGFRQRRDRDPRRLFSRWDEGIRLNEDPDARASLTPENSALSMAQRLRVHGQVVVDAFCGAGGNAIAFARSKARQVITYDTDRNRLEMARHNARIYGVEKWITFVHGDVFKADLRGQVGFFDPPWAGGEEMLRRCWAFGQGRFSRGGLKAPRTWRPPDTARLGVYTSPEGFPSMLLVRWP